MIPGWFTRGFWTGPSYRAEAAELPEYQQEFAETVHN
jgi:hypothetical protein